MMSCISLHGDKVLVVFACARLVALLHDVGYDNIEVL